MIEYVKIYVKSFYMTDHAQSFSSIEKNFMWKSGCKPRHSLSFFVTFLSCLYFANFVQNWPFCRCKIMSQIHARTFLLFFLVSTQTLMAQLPPRQPEQDCFSALSVCQDIYFQPNSYDGSGANSDEINGANSCMVLGERNSVWYIFKIETGGQLCFTISPVDSLDDYDWALYNITNASCAQIYSNPSLEVRCNWTFNTGCAGETGPNDRTDCPGQFEPCLQVNAGDTYVLNVSNFTSSNAGYTLDFTQSTAVLFDDTPPNVTGVESFCRGVTIEFDENVLCSSVDSLDFTFTGPDGPYIISEIRSQNCDNGGSFDRRFDLVIDPPIQQAGTYRIALVGFVSDFCNNGAGPYSSDIFMPLPPQAAINPQQAQCQDGNIFGFSYVGPSSVRSYFWDFGDGGNSTLPTPVYSYGQPGTFSVQQVITDVNGCQDTATQDIVVNPKPLTDFFAPNTLCQGESFSLINQTTSPGSNLANMTWRIGDGTVSQQTDLDHSFAEPGKYQVFLEAFNDIGCRDTTSRNITVYPNADIDFVAEENVCFGDTAHLVNISTIRTDIAKDQIVDWWWSMGDGDTLGMLTSVTHYYDTAGAFPVTLFVETDKGCVDSLTQIQEIHQPPPPDMFNDPVCFGERAFLQAIPEEGGVTRWYYAETDTNHFHIGATFPSPPVAYEFDYYVEVLSKEGCVGERVPLTVSHHPIGTGIILPTDSIVEFPNPIVNFGVEGSIMGDDFAWDFGDGVTGYGPQPVHQYKFPDKYPVTVVITDIYGCEYTLERVMEVKNLAGVHVPTAFTPNGDGFNDEWYIGHRLLQQFSISVYNRFGQEVFSSDSPDFRWDGSTPSGKQVLEGVYVYKVRGFDNLGNPIDTEGTVTVLK